MYIHTSKFIDKEMSAVDLLFDNAGRLLNEQFSYV